MRTSLLKAMSCALNSYLILLVLSCSYVSNGQYQPTIVTDQADYMAETTATLAGSSVQAFELVSVQIVYDNGADYPFPAASSYLSFINKSSFEFRSTF